MSLYKILYFIGCLHYISDVLIKIEINKIKQGQNEQLYNQKKEFDNKVEELIHKCNLLEIENGKLRKQ